MQPTPIAPSVVMNHGGERRQVPFRDYLNSRIAPFLKNAMTQSLEVEAEYPLQWLGECLINQSILFEGNPDTTNVKERFRYNFDAPPLVQEENTQEEVNGMEAAAVAAPGPTPVSTAPSEPLASNEPTMPNGAHSIGNESEQKPQEESQQGNEVAATDTVMGGTS